MPDCFKESQFMQIFLGKILPMEGYRVYERTMAAHWLVSLTILDRTQITFTDISI